MRRARAVDLPRRVRHGAVVRRGGRRAEPASTSNRRQRVRVTAAGRNDDAGGAAQRVQIGAQRSFAGAAAQLGDHLWLDVGQPGSASAWRSTTCSTWYPVPDRTGSLTSPAFSSSAARSAVGPR